MQTLPNSGAPSQSPYLRALQWRAAVEQILLWHHWRLSHYAVHLARRSDQVQWIPQPDSPANGKYAVWIYLGYDGSHLITVMGDSSGFACTNLAEFEDFLRDAANDSR